MSLTRFATLWLAASAVTALAACEAEIPEVTPVSSAASSASASAVATAAATPGLKVGSATGSAAPLEAAPVVREEASRTPYDATDTLSVDILWDEELRADTPVAMTVMKMAAGSKVPEHAHDDSDEILYVRTGSGTLVLDGKSYSITPGSAIFIPRGLKHSASFDSDTEAVQVYAPPGPEQRFKKMAADRAAAAP